jgi:hypothetical protein
MVPFDGCARMKSSARWCASGVIFDEESRRPGGVSERGKERERGGVAGGFIGGQTWRHRDQAAAGVVVFA